jgi:hypothetical protein
MLICALTLGAQNISVSSFRLLEKDLTANTAGTTEKDQNGEVAALIKVKTRQKGFVFDGGSLGIVKTVPKTGEIWVYVPRGLKKITVSHPQFGILRDYYLSMTVEAARTYEMVLLTNTAGQAQTAMFGGVDINSSPMMANIYVDGQRMGQTPQLLSSLSVGQHEVRISKRGYQDYSTFITIEENNIVQLSVHLDSLESQHVFSVGDVLFTMIRVEGGVFQMEATDKQGNDPSNGEEPVRKVSLPTFYIGETEVTQALWEAVMGNNPASFKGDERPVEWVNCDDCRKFIERLNQMTGQDFRLPTEAEWEFAARGGRKSRGYSFSGSNNIEEVAWYGKNAKETHEVKTKQPNELGIYDMSGNVWEWCQDDYTITSSHGARCGGSWTDSAKKCGVSEHDVSPDNVKSGNIGLRLAL